MSADHRGPDPTLSTDDRIRTDRPNATAGPNVRTHGLLERPLADSDRRVLPLSYRIERTTLRAQIVALERALETSENRRQAVIDHYERVLADRDDPNESSLSEPTSQSILTRLVDR